MPDGLFANPLHWVILLVIVLIIWGPGKLPSVGNALGRSIKEFKKASQDEGPYPATNPPAATFAPSLAMAAASPVAGDPSCPSCGKPNPAESRFCSDCGTSLVKPVEAEVVSSGSTPAKCEHCGTENPASNRFCAHCGKMVSQAMSRV